MKSNSWRVTLAQILLGGAIVLAIFAVHGVRAANDRVPLVTDWSHRHLLYSPPHSIIDQIRLSTHTRYVQQWMRENAMSENSGRGNRDITRATIQKDWNVYLGDGATVGAGMYPAKVSFVGYSCDGVGGVPPPDFVVFNTGLTGSSTAVAAFDNGAFTGEPGAGATTTITNGGSSITLTASNTSNAALNYRRSGTLSTDAANLTAAINRNGTTVGITASNVIGSPTLTITATTAGTAGNAITVTSSGTGLTWTFNNLVDGASGVPTVAAFDNLYSGCSGDGPVPSAYWAYNTGTGTTAATSVAASRNADQFAFVQNDGGGTLVLLKWAADGSTVNAPTTPTSVSATAYRNCTAPCMTLIPLSGGNTSYNSPPFVDYDHDTVYVGDDDGYLHQITGAFYGSPAETVTSGTDVWPAAVSVGNVLTGAIYDDALAAPQVFVASGSGFLYRVDATIGSGSGGMVTSVQMAATGFGIDDTPLLDASGSAVVDGTPTQGLLYVFARLDNGTYNGPGVFDIAAEFGAGTSGLEGNFSTDGTPPAGEFFTGNLDNAYWSTGTGHLYACSTNGNAAALWQATLTNTQDMSVPAVGPSLTNSNVQCSPITEYENGPTDRIFVSVTSNQLSGDGVIDCPATVSGCMMAFDITNPNTWGATFPTSATAAISGGGSGVIIDNDNASGGSQVYFTPLGSGTCTTVISAPLGTGIGGCAIQASQAGLQ